MDAGANCGLFTVLAARRGNRVLAIEGQQLFVREISAVLETNAVDSDLVQVEFARIGSAALLDDEDHEPGELGPHAALVELVDERGFERIDFLKMDIEGSEFGAFSPALLARTDRIAMEVHPEFGNPALLMGDLESAGFEWSIRNKDLQAVPSPPKDGFFLHAWRPG